MNKHDTGDIIHDRWGEISNLLSMNYSASCKLNYFQSDFIIQVDFKVKCELQL